MIPWRKEATSTIYHIDGDLAIMPSEALEKVFEDCLPIFDDCDDNKVILVSQLSRYITDPEHAHKRCLTTFRSAFISGLERPRRTSRC
jgi:hypothetical protein